MVRSFVRCARKKKVAKHISQDPGPRRSLRDRAGRHASPENVGGRSEPPPSPELGEQLDAEPAAQLELGCKKGSGSNSTIICDSHSKNRPCSARVGCAPLLDGRSFLHRAEQKTTVSICLSQKVNEFQKLECAKRQISSCARNKYTTRNCFADAAENGPFNNFQLSFCIGFFSVR